MDIETKGFDEKEEYKKLFKIRDEVFMNMQATMQLPGSGVFEPNMHHEYSSFKDQTSELPKHSYVLSEVGIKHKYSTMQTPCGIPIKDDKSRLERALRARIEKRKADFKILNEQGPPKKHNEQRLLSNQVHYRKNKEFGDKIKSNAKGPHYDTVSSYPVMNKGAHFSPKHIQELSAHESPVYHTENSKDNQTAYCENKDESSSDFLFTSMAIPGLRVSANVYEEENTEKSISTSITTQNIEEKSAHENKDLSNNSSVAKSLDLSLESKLISHDFRTYEPDTQNKSGSSSFEYKPRSPNSPLHLSPLMSPKIIKNVIESENFVNSKSISEPGQCSRISGENMQNTDDEKDLKESKRLDSYLESANSSNLIEQHNHQSYREIAPSRSMYWRRGLSPYHQRPFAPSWCDSRDYLGPFIPDEDPYVYYRDRAYCPVPSVPPESVKFRDYDPYYTPEFTSMRHSPSLSGIPPYPTYPMRFSQTRLFPPSSSFHNYPYSKHIVSPYPPSPYQPPISLRYDDSINYRPDSRYFYQSSRNSYDWDDFQGYYYSEPRSSIHSMGSISRYETIPYQMHLQSDEINLNTKQSSGQRENDWERTQWNRHR
ncbi:hypothetical protein PCANB_002926 [Pneumocystis canis]|nr:hypothetical protein PCANB_002926 [Pneumocystis canis]